MQFTGFKLFYHNDTKKGEPLLTPGSTGWVPVLIAGYMTILWTPITWFWIYNSLTATVVVIGLMVVTVRLLRGATAARSRGDNIVGTA